MAHFSLFFSPLGPNFQKKQRREFLFSKISRYHVVENDTKFRRRNFIAQKKKNYRLGQICIRRITADKKNGLLRRIERNPWWVPWAGKSFPMQNALQALFFVKKNTLFGAIFSWVGGSAAAPPPLVLNKHL